MTEHERESVDVQLAVIREHIHNIKQKLDSLVLVRHVNPEGVCDAWDTVEDHKKKINQWSGALGVVALLCALLGSFIGSIISKVLR